MTFFNLFNILQQAKKEAKGGPAEPITPTHHLEGKNPSTICKM